MNADEAIKEAESQINKCRYMRECVSGVYETGLDVVYKNKLEMLAELVGEIRWLKAENERLKASQPVTCENCKFNGGCECHMSYILEIDEDGCAESELVFLLGKKGQYCSFGKAEDME